MPSPPDAGQFLPPARRLVAGRRRRPARDGASGVASRFARRSPPRSRRSPCARDDPCRNALRLRSPADGTGASLQIVERANRPDIGVPSLAVARGSFTADREPSRSASTGNAAGGGARGGLVASASPAARGGDRRILLLDQRRGLGGPGHDLRVETGASRSRALPKAGAVAGGAQPCEHRLAFGVRPRKRRGRCASISARFRPRPRRSAAARHRRRDRARRRRASPCAFPRSTTSALAALAEKGEGLLRVLEKSFTLARLRPATWSAADRRAIAARERNRLITSSAAVAFSSATGMRRMQRGVDPRRPDTSACRAVDRVGLQGRALSVREGERARPARNRSRAAGTTTSSRSGQRSAVSLPPKTQPVSMQIVLLTQSASGVGVWP